MNRWREVMRMAGLFASESRDDARAFQGSSQGNRAASTMTGQSDHLRFSTESVPRCLELDFGCREVKHGTLRCTSPITGGGTCQVIASPEGSGSSHWSWGF